MAFSTRVSSAAISQINVTPLVDVLLVLLIIFMITAPVITHKVKIDLPQTNVDVAPPLIEPIRLTIQANGSMSWNDTPVDEATVNAQLTLAGLQTAQPALYINADDAAPYETVARVLASAKAKGLAKIDFVEE
ncbi:MAG: biopolymer transporter ExbD [Rhodanobacter sp.]